jgi:hypothetical protein
MAMKTTPTTTTADPARSCNWGVLIILLFVTLQGAFLWAERFGGDEEQMLMCGNEVEKLGVVNGAYSYAHSGFSNMKTGIEHEHPPSIETSTIYMKKAPQPALLRTKNDNNSTKTNALRTKKKNSSINTKPFQKAVEPQDLPTVFEGVRARPFVSFSQNQNQSLPCFSPEENWKDPSVQNTPSDVGFLFLKPYKTGSSTSSGISLRMARNVARRQQQKSKSPDDFEICRSRFDHARSSERFSNRKVDQSFLWTVIRSPAKRIVSQFFHFVVSREKKEPTDANMIEYIRSYARHSQSTVYDYYLGALSTTVYTPQPLDTPTTASASTSTSTSITNNKDAVQTANQILKDYNFIGITERMDESVVALSMLNGLALADVLYLKAKGHGGYDGGGGGRQNNKCTYIWPSFVSHGMRDFFETDEWKQIVHWDSVLYQAANRSLDLTIDQLGRENFETQLAKYQHAKEVVHDRCLPVTTFPCSPEGKYRYKTDCLWKDSACGMNCMDQVSTELGLW